MHWQYEIARFVSVCHGMTCIYSLYLSAQFQTPEPVVEYTSTGRPKRKVAKEIDYKSMLDDDSETFDFSQLLEKMNAEEER